MTVVSLRWVAPVRRTQRGPVPIRSQPARTVPDATPSPVGAKSTAIGQETNASRVRAPSGPRRAFTIALTYNSRPCRKAGRVRRCYLDDQRQPAPGRQVAFHQGGRRSPPAADGVSDVWDLRLVRGRWRYGEPPRRSSTPCWRTAAAPRAWGGLRRRGHRPVAPWPGAGWRCRGPARIWSSRTRGRGRRLRAGTGWRAAPCLGPAIWPSSTASMATPSPTRLARQFFPGGHRPCATTPAGGRGSRRESPPVPAAHRRGHRLRQSPRAPCAASPAFAPRSRARPCSTTSICTWSPARGPSMPGSRSLLPAQSIGFSAAGREARFYWHMPYRDEGEARFEDLKAEFRGLLPEVVGRAAGDVTSIGAFLSGGTDSSTVAGTLRQLRDEPIPTYSMGFATQGFDEIDYARIAARHFQTVPTNTTSPPEDVVECIPAVAGHCDEPLATPPSSRPTSVPASPASMGLPGSWPGTGVTRSSAAMSAMPPRRVFERYGKVPGPALGPDRAVVRPDPLLAAASRRCARRAATSPRPRSRCRTASRPTTSSTAPPWQRSSTRTFWRRWTPVAPGQSARGLCTHGIHRHGQPHDALGPQDHPSGQRPAQGRAGLRPGRGGCGLPLLDDAMVEFAARVPAEMQVKGGRLRWFFKRALDDFLPRKSSTRPSTASGSRWGSGWQSMPNCATSPGTASPAYAVATSCPRLYRLAPGPARQGARLLLRGHALGLGHAGAVAGTARALSPTTRA